MKSLTNYRGGPVERGSDGLDLGALIGPPGIGSPGTAIPGSAFGGAMTAAAPMPGPFAAARRHWQLALVATLVLGVLATVIVMSIPNRYQSWAAVLIEARTSQVVNMGSVVPDMAADDLAVDSEAQVLRSPSLAAQVVDKLQLAKYAEFQGGFFEGVLGNLLGDSRKAAQTTVLDHFMSSLAVERRGKSRVIQVSFTSRDPERAASVVNTLIGLYLQDQIARKVDATRSANKLLDNKLSELRTEVAGKEQAVENLRVQSGLVRGATAPAIDEQISQANAALAVARDELAQAQARRLSQGGDSSNAVVNNPLIQRLLEQQADLQSRLAQLSADYGPRHPTMINLEAQLARLRSSIATETAKVNQGFGQQERVAAARVADLQGTVARLRAQSGRDSDSQVKLRALEREADASRAVLDTFLRRYNETLQQAALQTADARVLGSAEPPPRPLFPSSKVLLGIGWVLALGVGGIGVPFVREMLSQRENPLQRIEVIERVAGPALAMVPAWSGSGGRMASLHNRMIDDPRGDFAEAVRSARTSLLFARSERRCKIVLLTSATAGEGKTALAVSIARSAALAGEDTLLVDVNLREPGVHRALDLPNERGVADYLERGYTLEALIQIDPRSPLEVVAAGRGSPTAPPLLTYAALTRLFDDLRARYRLVMLDGPALLSGSDTRFLASVVDEVVLVASADLSPQALSYALRQLNEAHVASLRVLINRVDMPALQEGMAGAAA